MATLFLIEDDAAVREQLAQLFSNAGHRVAAATRFDDLPQQVADAAPDLTVLDLGLPGTDGQFVARAIRQQSQVPILVLTSRSSELDELTSLSVGADDFVAKSANPQLLLAHVDALLRRAGNGANEACLKWGGLELDLARSRAHLGANSVELTKNELRILELLVRAKGGIVSRQRMMEVLWATDSFVDDNTLTVNINRLRQALRKVGAHDIVVTHRGQGYALKMPREKPALGLAGPRCRGDGQPDDPPQGGLCDHGSGLFNGPRQTGIRACGDCRPGASGRGASR